MRRITFAQLSDLHLMPPHGCRCWWMTDSPFAQLQTAITQLNAIPDLDFVVFTGDLVDQADAASFQQFHTCVQALNVPYYISVGNHDIDHDQSQARYTRSDFIAWCQSQFDLIPAPTGFVDYSLAPAPGIRLIALDATLGIHPEPQGTLRPIQLDWLQQELYTHAQEWVIMLIHQPPVAPSPLFRNYRICSQVAADLRGLLQSHGYIAAVLSGHLHVPKVYVRHQIPYLVAPPLVGPVSAFRVFELEPFSSLDYGVLRYHWHHVNSRQSQVRPLWHGVVMGHYWDRHGLKEIPCPVPVPHRYFSLI